MCTRKPNINTTIEGVGMKKRLRKVWQIWLVISIPISILGIFYWSCHIVNGSIFPIIMWVLNMGWLALICVANDETRIEKEKEKKHETKNTKNRIDEFQRHSA